MGASPAPTHAVCSCSLRSFRALLRRLNAGMGIRFLVCVWLGIGGGVFRIAVQDDGEQQATTDHHGHDNVLGRQERKVIGVGQSSQSNSRLHGYKTIGKHADCWVRQKVKRRTLTQTVSLRNQLLANNFCGLDKGRLLTQGAEEEDENWNSQVRRRNVHEPI